MHVAVEDPTGREEQFKSAREAAKWLWSVGPPTGGDWGVYSVTPATKRKPEKRELEFVYEILV